MITAITKRIYIDDVFCVMSLFRLFKFYEYILFWNFKNVTFRQSLWTSPFNPTLFIG